MIGLGYIIAAALVVGWLAEAFARGIARIFGDLGR